MTESGPYPTDHFFLTKREALQEYTPGDWNREYDSGFSYGTIHEPSLVHEIEDVGNFMCFGPGILHTCKEPPSGPDDSPF